MALAASYGLVACFLLCFALVGAAFMAWWSLRAEISRLPNPKNEIAPLEAKVTALQLEVARVVEAPATLRKRIDEAEEAAKHTARKIDSFTGQLGRYKRMLQERQLPESEPEAEEQQQFFPTPEAGAPAQPAAPTKFGVTLKRKAG